MKKSLFYSLMTTATLLSPIFAFPGWAKDCPEIPKEIKELTVKSKEATLRTEPDKGSKKGFSIFANDSLKILDYKSIVDKTGQNFCWYQVSAVKDKDNKPYFIADVGIKEFPFSNLSTGDKPDASGAKNTGNTATSGQQSNSPPPTNNKGTFEQNGVAQEKLSQYVSQQKWLTFVVIGISIGNIIILLLVCVEVSKVRSYLNISGLYRPSVKPYEKGTAPIDIQIKDSVAEKLASVAEELKELKNIQSIQRKLKRIQDDLGLKSQNDESSDTKKELTTEKSLSQVVIQSNSILEQIQELKKSNQSSQEAIQLIDNSILEQIQELKKSNQSSQEAIQLINIRFEDLALKFKELASKTPNIIGYIIGLSGEQQASHTFPGIYHKPETREDKLPETPSSSGQEFSHSSEDDQNPSQVTHTPITISPQLQEIIDRFNRQRPELFNDFSSQPLTLTKETIEGQVGANGRRILQLEIPADTSQEAYLKFEMDNASWLIPNIKSVHISKIMGNLGENSDIFTILPQGSGSSLQLIKPAKLKISTNNLQRWEIEEPGEFQFRSGRVESLEYNRQNTSSLGDQETPSNPSTDNFQSNYSFDDSQSYNQPDEVESFTTEISHSSGQISSKVTPTPITIFSQLKEIIDRFNQQRPDLFHDSTFQPLMLTQDSIRSGILQLEVSFDPSKATYLKFEMDNESWLIPNITSRYINQIMRNLGENSDIFTIRQGSGSSLQLIKPAKLKAVSNELWEIEEPGEFQL